MHRSKQKILLFTIYIEVKRIRKDKQFVRFVILKLSIDHY